MTPFLTWWLADTYAGPSSMQTSPRRFPYSPSCPRVLAISDPLSAYYEGRFVFQAMALFPRRPAREKFCPSLLGVDIYSGRPPPPFSRPPIESIAHSQLMRQFDLFPPRATDAPPGFLPRTRGYDAAMNLLDSNIYFPLVSALIQVGKFFA